MRKRDDRRTLRTLTLADRIYEVPSSSAQEQILNLVYVVLLAQLGLDRLRSSLLRFSSSNARMISSCSLAPFSDGLA
jgi:hypothetical protein